MSAEERDISLPNETLSTIFNELAPDSLAQLSRVCLRFNAVAERLLYSSIFIRDILSETSPVPWRTLRCGQSLLQRLHLVESIREVVIRWQVHPDAPPVQYDLNAACVQLAHSLPYLSYLMTLDLSLGPANLVLLDNSQAPSDTPSSDYPHVIERIIHGSQSRLPHLRNCSLSTEWLKGATPYTAILPAFLASLPSLRNLRLMDNPTGIPLRTLLPNALPQLSSFRGSLFTATFLLPGRPVQDLSLVGQDSDFVHRESLQRIANTTLPIRWLDLSSISVRTRVLKDVAEFLPTVECLRIRLALRHTLHYAASGIRLLTGLSSVLSLYHNLSHLDFSPTSSYPDAGSGHSNSSEVEAEVALCKEWERACPFLRTVVFPSQRRWNLDAISLVWTHA